MAQTSREKTGSLHRRIAVALCALASILIPVSISGAQNVVPRDLSLRLPSNDELRTVTIDPQLLQIVDQLKASDYRTREEASEKLRTQTRDNTLLYAILSRHSLTYEQRHRILAVVQANLLHAPRGALGIRMQNFPVRGAMNEPVEVEVVDLLPGLPAERTLKLKDRIVQVDGRVMFNMNDLRDHVQAKRPGDVILLMVKRGRRDDHGRLVRDEQNDIVYDMLEIELALGSARKLDRFDPNGRNPVSTIQRERGSEAGEAMRYFGPKPIQLQPHGEIPDTSQDMTQLTIQVNEIPAIQQRLLEQMKLEQQGRNAPEQMRTMWLVLLQQLERQLAQPGLQENERRMLEQVRDRYRELLEEDLP